MHKTFSLGARSPLSTSVLPEMQCFRHRPSSKSVSQPHGPWASGAFSHWGGPLSECIPSMQTQAPGKPVAIGTANVASQDRMSLSEKMLVAFQGPSGHYPLETHS